SRRHRPGDGGRGRRRPSDRCHRQRGGRGRAGTHRIERGAGVTLVPVEEPGDSRLADYVRLREVSLRRLLEEEHGLFIAEGDKVIRRAADAGYEPRSFLLAPRWLDSLQDVLEKWPDKPVYVVSEELAEQVTGFHVHRGALASYKRQPAVPLPDLLTDAV